MSSEDVLSAVREAFEAPAPPRDAVSFFLPIDGGGRSLIYDLVKTKGLNLMIETGCFLCGSTLQWLQNCPDLTVIGVDPWEGNWHETIASYYKNPVMAPVTKHIEEEGRQAVYESVKQFGPYNSALANVREYKDRFIPARGKSMEVLPILYELGVKPDLVYFDAMKDLDDMWLAHELWPDTWLTGDDWRWRDPTGRIPVQEAVNKFCQEHPFTPKVEAATWILEPNP